MGNKKSGAKSKHGKKGKKHKEADEAPPEPVHPAPSDAPREPMSRKDYERQLEDLHGELVQLQEWVKAKGLRAIIVFEGRDAAGKGGTIKALTERVSPRVFRVVALGTPSDREKSQMYMQRYMAHFPAAGEIVVFDRSWYNRALVEPVMGFCTEQQTERFLEQCPQVEKYIVDAGIVLIKFWLEVSDEEQRDRFEARVDDPRKQWKLSPVDLPAREKWYDYSRARDRMLAHTDSPHAPWVILRTDDKRRARLNCIAHVLRTIPFEKLPKKKVKIPEPDTSRAYDDTASLRGRKFVEEVY